MTERTRVYFTVDVAGAEERRVGKRVVPPQGYELRAWCRFRNQREDLGIGLMTRELEAHGLRATFFVEPFGAAFFGIAGLREVCDFLRGRGHDVQLLTHPVLRNAGFLSKGDAPAPDDLAAYDVETQATLLREGIAILAKAGVPREDVVALRPGKSGADEGTWAAMRKAGLSLSSSVCTHGTSEASRDGGGAGDARAALFEAAGEPGADAEVWELPVTAFRERGGTSRQLRVGAVSTAELTATMLAVRAMGAREICLVTSASELCHIDSITERLGRPSAIPLRRFRAACAFLRDNAADFTVDTCGALGKRLARGEERPDPAAPREMPRGSTALRARRIVEQALARGEARLSMWSRVDAP